MIHSCLSRIVSTAILTSVAALGFSQLGSPHKVEVVKGKIGFQLLRDGKPYKILGAGGDGDRNLLVSLGGNSIRTWGAENLGDVLDKAEAQGLTVTAGIWLGHREYFNYHDKAQVEAQFKACEEIVRKYKDHPALLMWSFGNEAEGDGKDPEVYKAINDIAAMSHKVDPNHPAMTVICESVDDKLKDIDHYCPAIDIVGVNSYGPGNELAERYSRSGLLKPYVVTEFGPPGPWESAKTSWGAPIEQTSTDKALFYEQTYLDNVTGNFKMCLGSYTFLWGNKIEGTPTWFGMLLPDGSPLGAVDTIAALWSGKKGQALAPRIRPIQLDGPASGDPGTTIHASVQVTGAKTIEWSLIKEIVGGSEDPDHPVPTETVDRAVAPAKGSEVRVRFPKTPGAYRLMVVARSAKGAATANVPIFVKGALKIDPNIPKAKLPVVVYREASEPLLFQPTGFMGDSANLTMALDCKDNTRSGKTCISVTFGSPSNWAGVAWQYPAKDWGDKPESVSLNGARKLTFWMRGADGGEKVKVEFGILGKEKKFPDSDHGVTQVELTPDWQKFEIDLSDKNLTKIKTGFVFTIGGAGHPQTFYIDDVQYE